MDQGRKKRKENCSAEIPGNLSFVPPPALSPDLSLSAKISSSFQILLTVSNPLCNSQWQMSSGDGLKDRPVWEHQRRGAG